MINDQDYTEHIPAYVLGALEPDEAATFEARIAQDSALRAEVVQYRKIVADLPLATRPVRPPAALKARLLAEVTATQRPMPAFVPVQSVARASVRQPRRVWPGAAFAGAALLLLLLGVALFSVSAQLRTANSTNAQLAAQLDASDRALDDLRRQQQELNAQLEAAQRREDALAVDLDASRAELAQMRQEIATNEQLVAFLSTADVASRTLSATDTATTARGAMYMRPGQRDAVVLVTGLPALAPGESYQFWLAQDGAPMQFNAGVLLIGDDGNGQLVVHAPLAVNDFGEVMVTVEHEQQASVPSEITVLRGRL